MPGSDVILSGLFLSGILVSVAADQRLRRLPSTSWREGCLTALGVVLVFAACAAALR